MTRCRIALGLLIAVVGGFTLVGVNASAHANDPAKPKTTEQKLDDQLAALDADARTRVRVTEYWNRAIWAGSGSRYPNDWNRNVGALMRTDGPRVGVLYAARSAAHRAELIRGASSNGVPAELVDIADRLASMYDELAQTTLAALEGENQPPADEAKARKLNNDVEALRVKLNREHGLQLVPVEVVNQR
jgi:hypothetical protein